VPWYSLREEGRGWLCGPEPPHDVERAQPTSDCDLPAAFEAARNDAAVRDVILTVAAEKAFIPGADSESAARELLSPESLWQADLRDRRTFLDEPVMSETLPVVYLARHGETARTISRLHTGVTDLPLYEHDRSDRVIRLWDEMPREQRISPTLVRGSGKKARR
jgi:hypothetical protein